MEMIKPNIQETPWISNNNGRLKLSRDSHTMNSNIQSKYTHIIYTNVQNIESHFSTYTCLHENET